MGGSPRRTAGWRRGSKPSPPRRSASNGPRIPSVSNSCSNYFYSKPRHRQRVKRFGARALPGENEQVVKRSWAELPLWVRRAIVGVGAAEMALLLAAQVDISRQPAERIRGSKTTWRLLAFINFFGPITYFRRGRVKPTE